MKITLYRVIFLTGPALKVRSVGDGKVPTKKVKVLLKFSHFLCDIPLLHFFGKDFATSNTFRAGPVKKITL